MLCNSVNTTSRTCPECGVLSPYLPKRSFEMADFGLSKCAESSQRLARGDFLRAMDRYRVVFGGNPPQLLELERGSLLAEAHLQVASLLGLDPQQVVLLLRNAPTAALPVLRLPSLDSVEASEPFWRLAPPNSVLLVELDPGIVSEIAPSAPSAPSASTASLPHEPAREAERVEDKERGLQGLRNLGNTCYLNSGVQCLSHTTLLRQKLLETDESDGATCRAFKGVVQGLWAAESPAPGMLKVFTSFPSGMSWASVVYEVRYIQAAYVMKLAFNRRFMRKGYISSEN
ncbi:unnamed protein product [Effrenium voratum]|nr:unnamed protein product [Effrenium voratum]